MKNLCLKNLTLEFGIIWDKTYIYLKMIKKNWTAVIPAAGKSKRFNYKQSKIFYKYKKKFLIEHSVDKIKKHISKF